MKEIRLILFGVELVDSNMIPHFLIRNFLERNLGWETHKNNKYFHNMAMLRLLLKLK